MQTPSRPYVADGRPTTTVACTATGCDDIVTVHIPDDPSTELACVDPTCPGRLYSVVATDGGAS